MAEKITYTEAEFEPFLDIRIRGGGTISKDSLEEYANDPTIGRKITAKELRALMEFAVDPVRLISVVGFFANVVLGQLGTSSALNPDLHLLAL